FTGFITRTRSQTLPHPANTREAIRDLARALLAGVPEGTVRLIGIRLSNLQERGPAQKLLDEYLSGQARIDPGDT
ncbi:MAG: hypothetical protein LUQ67_05380, partial [Methanomicrobiales archaeon]|nr:hypothetical protein [Methanomicrobiales archaeon]